MHRELVEGGFTNRGKIVPSADIFPIFYNHPRFASMHMFGPEILTHVKINKSVRDFTGKLYSEGIWIDIDSEGNIEDARLSTINLILKLNIDFQINPEHIFIYFSGNKGFHILIFNKIIGFAHSDPITIERVIGFVKRLAEGISHIDYSIYDPVRILRIENSKHEKSGLYKIRISYDELNCEVDDILQLAKSPRKYPYKNNIDLIKFSPGLNRIWTNEGNYIQEEKQFESSGNLFQPPKEGSRNNKLFIQACILFRNSELSTPAITNIITNAAFISNINSQEPLEANEIKNIISSAERSVGEERKKTSTQSLQLKSCSEWLPEWENHILLESTRMSLCFPKINNITKGKLKGKLGVFMGYGGAKKSLLGLNIALENLINNDEIAIYSTMEMGIPQLMNRILDYGIKADGECNPHEMVETIYKRDVTEGREFTIRQLAKLGNRLQIIPNSRMTYKEYKETIRICNETVGKPSVLIVDGLSMMGGKGTETELYSQNSADLKQLANEENILVILICHVSKGADRCTRDLAKHIRGSEKILDNCDFYATLSQIEDDYNPENLRQDIGFIKFCDKRGTGQIIDIVYSFDSKQLKLSQSDLDPKEFYNSSKARKPHDLF